MKLRQLKEAVVDHDNYMLLQRVSVELGYKRLQLHDSMYYNTGDDADAWHYDGAPDIDTAIELVKLPAESQRDTLQVLNHLQHMRLMNTDDIWAPNEALKSPLKRLRGVAELAAAFKQVEQQQDWVQVSAKNVATVLLLLNSLREWASRDAPRGSEESFKITIAKTALRRLGIPLENEQ